MYFWSVTCRKQLDALNFAILFYDDTFFYGFRQ